MGTHRLSRSKPRPNSDRLSDVVPSLTLDEAVEQFLLHQRASRHSPRTIENYEYSLGKLKAWLADQGITNLETVKSTAIRQYLADLQAHVSSGTVATAHRRIKAFLVFHENEGNLDENPIRTVKPPKVDRELLPAFTPEEVKKLLDATAGRDPINVRNRSIVTMLLDSGMRLQELTSLRVGDVCTKSGVIHVKKGKGGKDRITKLGAEALRAYNRYLRIRGGEVGTALWLGERGPLSREGIALTVSKIGKSCGVHAHPHKFRRTTALTMLRNGCSIYSLQRLLGHSDASLSILRRYLAQTEADITADHERFSVLDHLS